MAFTRLFSITSSTWRAPISSVRKVFPWESRLPEDILDSQCTAWHIGGVLQDYRITGHEGRNRTAENLPEGKVPGHDRQYQPQRPERDSRPGSRHCPPVRRQGSGGMVSVVVACPCALFQLGTPLRQRLSHLEGHQFGVFSCVQAQNLCSFIHQNGPLGNGSITPTGPRPWTVSMTLSVFSAVQSSEYLHHLSGGRIY